MITRDRGSSKRWHPEPRPSIPEGDRASATRVARDFYQPLPIRVEAFDAPLTSDAGPLPLRQFDDRIGLTARFAALHDLRDPNLVNHIVPEMVRSRVFGILAGHED